MLHFTSDRERRLWLWLLVTLFAIYATMGVAASAAAALRARGLLEPALTAAVVAAVALVLWHWRQTRPNVSEMSVALGVASVYWAMWVRIPLPEERTHLLEYSAVAILIHMALLERHKHTNSVPYPALLALSCTLLLGFVDEAIQSQLPSRFYDNFDVLFNSLAAIMAIGTRVTLATVARWTRVRRLE